MTNTAPYRRTVTYTVNEVAAVEGNYGPQWQLSGDVSAMPNDPRGGNWGKFPSRFWLDQSEHTQPAVGTYQCVIERGEKGKPEYNGDIEWQWRWKMIEFNTDTIVIPPDGPATPTSNVVLSKPAPPQSAAPQNGAAGSFESDADRRDRTTRDSIHRQVALKAAVEMAIAQGNLVVSEGVSEVLMSANTFYKWLSFIELEPINPAQEPTEETPPSEQEPELQKDTDELTKIAHLRDNAPAQLKVADFTAATVALDITGEQIVAYFGNMSRRQWIEEDEESRTNRDALLLVLEKREAELRQTDTDFEELQTC